MSDVDWWWNPKRRRDSTRHAFTNSTRALCGRVSREPHWRTDPPTNLRACGYCEKELT